MTEPGKTVPWSKGRTPAFHAGDIGFKSHGDHYGWVCLAARAADCKSVTRKHRRFESFRKRFGFYMEKSGAVFL